MVQYKKGSKTPSITWSEAVDEALCFGWIDSKKVKIDDEISHQYFCKRGTKSTWSKINKDKIEQLIATGKMTPAGLKCIEIAKKNGSWSILDEVEQLIIPADLIQELQNHDQALEYFESLSKSNKKLMLSWLVFAKTQATRQKRINQIVTIAVNKQKP